MFTCMKYGKAKTIPQGIYRSRPIRMIIALTISEKIIQIHALPHSFPKTRHVFFPSKSHTASIIRIFQGSNECFGFLPVTNVVIKNQTAQDSLNIARLPKTFERSESSALPKPTREQRRGEKMRDRENWLFPNLQSNHFAFPDNFFIIPCDRRKNDRNYRKI